jgi:BMFP domain-containing protein YqiC
MLPAPRWKGVEERISRLPTEEKTMQTSNRLLDDLAKVASGAASTLAGIKDEINGLIRQQLERLVADLDLVGREEFEAVKATAATARAEQEKLEKRMVRLEAKLPATKKPPTSRTRKAAKPKE